MAAIKQNITDGVSPEEIAVIVRTNKEVEAIAAGLRKAGVLASATASGDILVHPITQTIEALIGAVVTDTNEMALFTVMHGAYWGLTLSDIIKIAGARSYDTTLFAILSSPEKLAELGVTHAQAAQNIVTVIETARAMMVTEPPHRVLEFILVKSGFVDYVIAQNPFEGARVIRRLYDEIESLVVNDNMSTLQSIRDLLATRRTYGVAMDAPFIETNVQSVKVMTAHKSKGLEFEVVYVPHLQDSNWGGGSSRTTFTLPLNKVVLSELDKIDDEKRLLYVAMTRAKRELHFSDSSANSAGKVLIPSRLCDEITTSLIAKQTSDTFTDNFNPVGLFSNSAPAATINTGLLSSVLAKRGFSATSLNNYLKNPWDYVYRNVLRIPEVQPAHMQFGTAVHSVLEYATKAFSETGKLPSDTIIKQKLESSLSRLPLSTNEFVRLLEKGLTVIYPYLTHMKGTLSAKSKEELSIRVILPTGLPELPELPLTGKLDRIDINESGKAVRVVDYKTGKPKTRNAIEGKTESSDGAYKRQLVFYTLLLKLYNDERYYTNTGTLSFVEPDAKGVIHEETFIVTDDEVESLQAEIITAAQDILSGDFLLDHTIASESKYAHLIALLK